MSRVPLLLLRAEGHGSAIREESLSDDDWAFCKAVLEGEYETALQHKFFRELLDSSGNVSEPLASIESKIATLCQDASDQQLLLLLVAAVAALQSFIQCNWTGPPFVQAAADMFQLPEDVASALQAACLARLSENGEECYVLSTNPVLLWLARQILCSERLQLQQPTAGWWHLRCLMAWQQVIGDKMASIWEKVDSIRKQVIDDSSALLSSLESDEGLKCQLYLELTISCLYFSQLAPAHEHLQVAMSKAGLQSIGLTGALGKRTRFQDFDTAQLTLDVQTCSEGQSTDGLSSTSPSATVRNIQLDDDTVLDKIAFTEPVENASLNNLQLAAILAKCLEIQKSGPMDGLTKEETLAFVERILAEPRAWSIQSRAFLLRCHSESEKMRRMERAMMQLQGMVDAFSDISPPPHDRLYLFHCSDLPPRWMVERDLAKQLMQLGVIKSALDIFRHLQMWDDVIVCLQTLGRHGEAEELVRDRLAMQETPTLLCSLGDLTKDPAHYVRAWELSKHRSTRAQRSLGLLYLREGKFKECVEHLQLSLQVNSLQDKLWFSLGCAAMTIEDFPLAARALHRAVTLEYDHYEAWNNLASVHIRMGQKPKAHKVLHEALRCNFEKWQIWQNFLLVSTDVGEFEDVLNAMHRLADLHPKGLDDEVLKIVVNAILEDLVDARGAPAGRLLAKALKAFGHISSKVTSNENVWKQYSRLQFRKAEKEMANEGSQQTAQDVREMGLQCLQKAQRLSCQRDAVKHSVEALKGTVDLTLELEEACELVSHHHTNPTLAVQTLSSAKMTLRGMIALVKKFTPADDQTQTVADLLETLEERLSEVTSRIQDLKASA